MKRNKLIFALTILLMMVVTTPTWAQGCGYGNRYRNCGAQCGWGRGCQNGYCAARQTSWVTSRHYDPATVEQLRGEIIKVETVKGRGRLGGIHLLVKTDKETIPVHVGPQWYLQDHDVTFKEGDKVDIHGSRTTVDDEKVVIADRITCKDTTLKLRNSDGNPLWSGHGRAY